MMRRIILSALFGLAIADETWTINPSSNFGTWEGWGVSLAWWGKAFGNRDDVADIFFTLDTTALNSHNLPGLGFNIARYNAGACSNNTFDSATMVESPKMNPSRQMDGYWWDWASGDPQSTSWHWDVDANQRAMLQKAAARGANYLELFSNSPMWWMLANRNPSGSDDGKSDNLQSWNYENHTQYLGEIATYAKDNWNIVFNGVDAFNEPSADWWNGLTGTQEGCHFEVSTMATIIPMMRAELDSRGLTSTIVSAADENSYDEAVSTFKGLGSEAIKNLGRINVHGYQQAEGDRSGLYSLTSQAGLKLWNSEYGENDASGSSLVSNLILDFRWLHPTAWVYWQAIDGGGWGLIDGDNNAVTLGDPTQKYFCLALFSRHIREGMYILDGGSDHVVAAYDPAKEKLIVVAVNWGAAQTINFDLSNFATAGTSGQKIPRWSTQMAGGNQYVSFPADTAQNGKTFGSHFEQNEVQTFEVGNVKI
ncbi:unnamed protein product [Discula destructiva]